VKPGFFRLLNGLHQNLKILTENLVKEKADVQVKSLVPKRYKRQIEKF
jgi:hypothetical protein